MEMERRRAATQKTLDRYRDKPFDWQRGITCVHLARYQMRNMGHKPQTIPRIRSALAAKRAMGERGWPNVSAMLDEHLPRIAPAQMLLGDLVTFPGTDTFDAIAVCAGPQKVLSWHESATGMVVLDVTLDEITGAWRV